ncbi:hypothetical protein [Brevibacterium luteolum]|uniref:hypothetical protein n=1 Tax=Brevibacterium luteolum TaxID=199591 RepID=UPI003B67A9A8
MATAFRLSSGIFLSALDSNATYIADEFEAELVDLPGSIPLSRSDVVGREGGPTWAESGVANILIATSPQPQLEARAHRMSRIDDSVTVPIIIDHPFVRFGPIADGIGGCSECLRARLKQHGLSDDFERMRISAFGGQRGGPNLLLPHEIEYLFARTLAAFEQLERNSYSHDPGRVIWLDLMNTSSTSGTVSGIHGCGICGGQAGTPEDRTWKYLAEAEV